VAAAEPAPAPHRRRIWVSGATGFVGSAVVRHLLNRGDEVLAPVRDPRRAAWLSELGATVIQDDLSDVRRTAESLRDVDGAIHAAGRYRIGIPKSDRGAMWDANIGATTRVLDALEAAGTPRLVYVSTVTVFGDTHGQVVDESFRRTVADGFTSWYDETKFGAHEVVLQRIAGGAPVVVVLPSQVYGPGDHSEVGEQLRRAHRGQLRYTALAHVAFGLVHVDDLAVGIVAALDRGEPGQSYILSGPRTTLGEAIEIAARLGGHQVPRLSIPTGVLRLAAPLGGLVGQPNLRETIGASDGVTYWAAPAKAVQELGFEARSIEDGLRETFGGSRRAGPGAAGG
jgi:nucleoside-diphosphate-sugar epimerase